jgi:hypothetical protein
MSETGRWDVDTINGNYQSQFLSALSWYMPQRWSGDVYDLVTELVAEIERLQTENIELQKPTSERERNLFARLWALTALHSSMTDIWNDKEQMMQQRIDKLERENAELRACANIDAALRPADGDTKWTERFKGLYEGHHDPE